MWYDDWKRITIFSYPDAPWLTLHIPSSALLGVGHGLVSGDTFDWGRERYCHVTNSDPGAKDGARRFEGAYGYHHARASNLSTNLTLCHGL